MSLDTFFLLLRHTRLYQKLSTVGPADVSLKDVTIYIDNPPRHTGTQIYSPINLFHFMIDSRRSFKKIIALFIDY